MEKIPKEIKNTPASIEEIWNRNSKTFDSGYCHNTHIDYMGKETFIKLFKEYGQAKEKEWNSVVNELRELEEENKRLLAEIKRLNDDSTISPWDDLGKNLSENSF